MTVTILPLKTLSFNNAFLHPAAWNTDGSILDNKLETTLDRRSPGA